MEAYLCDTCQSFGLEPGQFVGSSDWLQVHNADNYLDLGTTKSILEKEDKCSLCRLVVHSLHLHDSKTPIVNQDGSYTTCRLQWKSGSPRWNHVLQKEETPNFLSPAMRNLDEKTYDDAPVSRCSFVPSGEDMKALGAESTTFYGRTPCPTQGYFERIKLWISQCSELHGSHCDHSERPNTTIYGGKITVIDVQRACLVDIPISHRYFTLSYVWGAIPFFETLKANVAGLKEQGGIKKIEDQLPKTITDAMHLLATIGEQYLWTDRLSIVQDDARAKHSIISRMDEVYDMAYACIIARSGSHADAGLFGQHDWHREEQVLPNMRLVSVLDYLHDNALGDAPIENRGWTFQEQLLSRRSLIFCHGLASFQCNKTIWRQDVILEDVEDATNTPKLDWGFLYKEPVRTIAYNQIFTYGLCVEAYSKRNLSFPSDAIAAFSGIGRVLESALKTKLYVGLPVAIFDWALLWTLPLDDSRCNLLPSWSWAGWAGKKTQTLEECPDLLIYHTWIRWYYDDSEVGIVRPLRDLEIPPGRVCMTKAKELEIRHTPSHEYAAGAMVHCNKTVQRKDNVRLSVSRFQRYSSSSLESRVDPFPSEIPLQAGTLRFYTVCATFNVVNAKITRPFGEIAVIQFRDKHNLACGTINSTSQKEVTHNLSGRQDVILLSEHNSSSGIENEETYLQQLQATRVKNLKSTGLWKQYNVMVIDWVDGVAYRKATGVIWQVALDFAVEKGAVWRQIVLR